MIFVAAASMSKGSVSYGFVYPKSQFIYKCLESDYVRMF